MALKDFGMDIKEFFFYQSKVLYYDLLMQRTKYPSHFVNDIYGYQLLIIERIEKFANSYFFIAKSTQNYALVGALVRVLADYVAGYRLIYLNPNKEEVLLRHYLYIIDGLQRRINEISGPLPKMNSVPQQMVDELNAHIESSCNYHLHTINVCIEEIKKQSLYKNNSDVIDCLIEQSNWRYKELRKGNRNWYSWNELYSKQALKGATHFTEFSCFIHGLSTCQLDGVIPDEFIDKMWGLATALVNKTIEVVNLIFDVTKEKQEQIILQVCKDKEFSNIMKSNESWNKLLNYINKIR
ncbi:MAG: hypothetical protein MJZ79_07720 [Paludibacteraceae bacterium]|nr:hypothetical protein [Paludibacteraceae bacterium]